MSPPPPSYSTNSSLLVIAILLAFAFAFTVLIHLIIRLLARLSSLSNPTNPTSSAISYASNVDPPRHKSLVDSLPVFTLSSIPGSPTSNCSICLSQFSPSDRVRLLPACLHAFHSPCIETWLKSSPSCPLCRSAVQCDQYVEPMQQPPPQQQQGEAPPPPDDDDAAAEGGSWLKEYVDRLVVSAPSSFNSMRFLNSGSGRRFDEHGSGSLELGDSFRSEDRETGYFAASFKWIMAAAATNSHDSTSPC